MLRFFTCCTQNVNITYERPTGCSVYSDASDFSAVFSLAALWLRSPAPSMLVDGPRQAFHRVFRHFQGYMTDAKVAVSYIL